MNFRSGIAIESRSVSSSGSPAGADSTGEGLGAGVGVKLRFQNVSILRAGHFHTGDDEFGVGESSEQPLRGARKIQLLGQDKDCLQVTYFDPGEHLLNPLHARRRSATAYI